MLIIVMVFVGGSELIAQIVNDPRVITRDGQPVISPADAQIEHQRKQTYQHETKTITHIEGTINRTPSEVPAYAPPVERERRSHFKNDTTKVYSYDDAGRPIKDPYSVYREVGDTVKSIHAPADTSHHDDVNPQ